jgi:hypothetical protein
LQILSSGKQSAEEGKVILDLFIVFHYFSAKSNRIFVPFLRKIDGSCSVDIKRGGYLPKRKRRGRITKNLNSIHHKKPDFIRISMYLATTASQT